jgi:hypothetical protein
MAKAGLLLTMVRRSQADELAAGKAYGQRALTMARSVGSRRAEIIAIGKLVEAAYLDGDVTLGHELAQQAVGTARELGDAQLLGEALNALALSTADQGKRRQICEEGLACSRGCGDHLAASGQLDTLFSIELHAGRVDEGARYLEDAIDVVERIGGGMLVYFMHSNLALLRLCQGRFAEAEPLVRESLLFCRRMPAFDLGEMIFAGACIAAWRGDLPLAARLFGAGDVDIEASLAMRMIVWSPAEQSLREREQGRVRELLGADAYEAEYRAGAVLPLAQARDLALGRAS